ncbi:hypothetical protein MMCCUG48898_1199 [Mycobacteroides abscessus subsp. massiliense CCUG 48898 = JCM 15300]|nr:hypothetical protein MMCCUG48898_1199 [Mycobacteroides abscessus subsp. massiliense CCUG 48898 = JCM 15300]
MAAEPDTADSVRTEHVACHLVFALRLPRGTGVPAVLARGGA